MKAIYKYIIAIVSVILLILLPIALLPHAAFGGADDEAISMILQTETTYMPWLESIKLFDSSELMSSLFALQAAFGAAIIAYYIGYTKGKKQQAK
jgi:cobalt transport protein